MPASRTSRLNPTCSSHYLYRGNCNIGLPVFRHRQAKDNFPAAYVIKCRQVRQREPILTERFRCEADDLNAQYCAVSSHSTSIKELAVKSNVVLFSLWLVSGTLCSMLIQAKATASSPSETLSSEVLPPPASEKKQAPKKNRPDEISNKTRVDRREIENTPEAQVTAITETPHDQQRRSFLMFLQILRSAK